MLMDMILDKHKGHDERKEQGNNIQNEGEVEGAKRKEQRREYLSIPEGATVDPPLPPS